MPDSLKFIFLVTHAVSSALSSVTTEKYMFHGIIMWVDSSRQLSTTQPLARFPFSPLVGWEGATEE